jgi:hypothetical protein
MAGMNNPKEYGKKGEYCTTHGQAYVKKILEQPPEIASPQKW